MVEWGRYALEALDRGQPCALISLLAVEGSTPREAGTRMVVTPEASFGTIGGGHLEYLAVQQAQAALNQAPGTWRIQDYPLGPLLGQCCGGRVLVMIERLSPEHSVWLKDISHGGVVTLTTRLWPDHVERSLDADANIVEARGPQPVAGERFSETVGEVVTPLAIFGAGHVAQAILRMLPGLPFSVQVYDTRPEYAAIALMATTEDLEAKAQSAQGLVLIMTHDHALDYRLVTQALRGPAHFVGLIGSQTKRARFLGRLRRDGFDEATLSRLTCPIGVAGIVGKSPPVIAVSVIAQLLQVRHG